MKIPKAKAIELIDEKIRNFEEIRARVTPDDWYDEDYELEYKKTEMLLTELFSEEEAKKFLDDVEEPYEDVDETQLDDAEEFEIYNEQIGICIRQLEAYRERIDNFWHEETGDTSPRRSVLPFLSMSFDEVDKDINEYVTKILETLEIDYETGERYSKESIPEKIQSRIRSSDLFLAFLLDVKSWKVEDTPHLAGCSKN